MGAATAKLQFVSSILELLSYSLLARPGLANFWNSIVHFAVTVRGGSVIFDTDSFKNYSMNNFIVFSISIYQQFS
jgi:hypothetical protein